MAGTFKLGVGSVVSVASNTAANATFTALNGVLDITLPSVTRDQIETTHQGSNSKEYISGLKDYGEVSFDMNWEVGSVTDTTLTALVNSGDVGQLRYQVGPSGNTFVLTETYTGIFTNYERNAPVGDKMTATATFKPSTKV